MRSPFHYFRKHQKLLLAVFGVALMIVFTVGSVALQYLDDSGQGPVDDSTVVTFKGGSLNQQEMENLRFHHNLLMAYLRTVMDTSRQRGGRPGTGMIRMGDSDQDLLQTHLLAKQAREMGIVITDGAVIDFLRELTDDKIPTPQFGTILEARLKNQMNEEMLFVFLREELAAKSVEDLVLSGHASQSPGGRPEFALEPSRTWEYFTRLNRELTAEVLPVPVADFVEEVPEPSSEQVAEFFEEFKDRFSFPNDPEPGFKQRTKIAVAYVQGDYRELLEEEKAKVSNEAVEAYYNEHQEDYIKTQLPSEEDEADAGDEAAKDGDDPEAADPEATDPEATDAEAPDTGTSDTTTDDPDSSATQPPAEDDADPASEPKEPEKSTVEQQPTAPAEGDATDDAAGDDPAPDPSDSTENSEAAPEPAAADAGEQPETEPAESGTEAAGESAESGESAAEQETTEPPAEPPADDGSSYRAFESGDGSVFVAFDDTAADPPAVTSDATPANEGDASAPEPTADSEPATANDETDAGDNGANEESEPKSEGAKAEADSAGPDVETTADQNSTPESTPGADSESPAKADSAEDEGQPAEAAPTVKEDAPDSEDAPKSEDGADSEHGAESEDGADTAETPSRESSEPPKPPEYKPLEEVRDQVLRSLAAEPAQERFDLALDTIRAAMDDYYQERARWEALRTEEPDAPQPEPPNVKELAEKHGLKVGSTPGEVDVFDFQELEIGKASDTNYRQVPTPDGNWTIRPQTTTLTNEAFTEGLPLYRAKRFPSKTAGPGMFSAGNKDVQYVFWKTAETEETVPELDDVRDEVVQAWKLREATKLAEQAAKKMAEQARASGVSLVSEFGKEKVTETETFTFFDAASLSAARSGQGRMLVSQIPDVEAVGFEFMEAVFDLSKGDIGVAVNQPQTEYFVVRVKTDQPNAEDLREKFLTRLTFGAQAGLPDEVNMMALTSLMEYRQSWLKDFEKEREVVWKRDPQPGTPQEI